MSQRLIKILAPKADHERVAQLLRDCGQDADWTEQAGKDMVFSVLLSASDVEPLLDRLTEALPGEGRLRAAVVKVESSLPAETEVEEEDEHPLHTHAPILRLLDPSTRISRDELRAQLGKGADLDVTFLALVLLSIVVAAVGLERSNATIIIGAMVIAPLLGPNMALALATTLGETTLFVRAARTSLVGGGLTFVCSYLIGLGITLEGPLNTELASRTSVAWGDLALALASGMAGALAVVAGTGMSLVGVMVAVALLPPLVTVGLLSANGRTEEAMGALFLVATNIVCVNLASMATFLVRGVRPQHWWQSAQSARYSRVAMIVWITLLTVIAALLLKQHLAAQAH